MEEGIVGPHYMKALSFDQEPLTQVALDIMKEKAEALGRAGERLDESLRSMKSLDHRITMLKREGKGAREVNALMREFNEIRKRALGYLHHLIIQREAIGFRRHANVTRIYQIPPKKRPLSQDYG